MKLSKIKLAGFKSFVDPTTIQLNSNLVGIVGPNGCGKSNVIDAIRWVMGESSAKHLRGDSMADVIFNGSTARKPVGQASVELVFDNTDGKLGGQYAEYNEISVKRTVTRDGTSVYNLNGARCRRKDITEIFLGTGLGPRSYAIIEQGMISRLIDAKPEELRVYIEEAAGISKYKERRRETENRIRHTRDNLDRLTDVIEELGSQLDRLQRQANTAEKYKVLKQDERLLKAQLLVLKWALLDEQTREQQGQIQEKDTLFEKHVADQRHLEAEIEKQRDDHVKASDEFNAIQERFYSIGAEISRIEQSIQHAKDRKQQQQADLQDVEKIISETSSHLDMDQRQIEDIKAVLAEAEPKLEKASETERVSGAEYADAEQTMSNWQQGWEGFNEQSAETSREVEVNRTRIQHLDENIIQLNERSHRLEQEQEQITPGPLVEEIEIVQSSLLEMESTTAGKQDKLNNVLTQINTAREQINTATTKLDETRNELQTARGRQASLEALQQSALGKTDNDTNQWLENNNLHEAKRLAQSIQVDNGWERAVECVMGSYLEAVCVDNIDTIVNDLIGLQHGSLSFVDKSTNDQPQVDANKIPLMTKVQSDFNLDLLLNVFAVNNLEDALQLRNSLASNESVVTPEGIWLGRSWLRISNFAEDDAGVLQREQEINEHNARISALVTNEAEINTELETCNTNLMQLESDREITQSEINEINAKRAEIQSDLSAKQERLEQMNSRMTSLKVEVLEIKQKYTTDQENLATQRHQLEELIEKMETLSSERVELVKERDTFQADLEQSREKARHDREAAHTLALEIQSNRTALDSTQQSLERVKKQYEQVVERKQVLDQSLFDAEAPMLALGEELDLHLEQRVGVESELGDARKHVEDIDHSLGELSRKRNEVEKIVQETRSGLDESRMAFQEFKVRSQTLLEQIQETDFELEVLKQEMPEEANVAEWEEKTTKTGNRIQRLGAINLAAIEEFEEQSERKVYLDAQHSDLIEALETLESAISKIDKETRDRFRDTFELINTSFKARFPKLFGGGQAYLELTGDDLLDTGVAVMARPPGKRNSTIHLLSGGEKALTAIAMVFAIFELNPAPFCLLDEVDAPLDDANVSRFCEVVKNMSEQVQFLFITHNKVTMEIPRQLNGVTMQEAGVSRIVAVDVDEAVELAAM